MENKKRASHVESRHDDLQAEQDRCVKVRHTSCTATSVNKIRHTCSIVIHSGFHILGTELGCASMPICTTKLTSTLQSRVIALFSIESVCTSVLVRTCASSSPMTRKLMNRACSASLSIDAHFVVFERKVLRRKEGRDHSLHDMHSPQPGYSHTQIKGKGEVWLRRAMHAPKETANKHTCTQKKMRLSVCVTRMPQNKVVCTSSLLDLSAEIE